MTENARLIELSRAEVVPNPKYFALFGFDVGPFGRDRYAVLGRKRAYRPFYVNGEHRARTDVRGMALDNPYWSYILSFRVDPEDSRLGMFLTEGGVDSNVRYKRPVMDITELSAGQSVWVPTNILSPRSLLERDAKLRKYEPPQIRGMFDRDFREIDFGTIMNDWTVDILEKIFVKALGVPWYTHYLETRERERVA